MTKKIMLSVVFPALILCAILSAAQVTCPMCHGKAYATGETKVDSSGVLWKYQCLTYSTHKFWMAK